MKFRALSLAALCGACLLSAAKLEAAMGDFTYATSVAAANSPTVPSAPSPFPGGPATTLLDIGNGNSLSFVGTNTPDVAGAAFPGGADINFGRVDFLPDAGNATVTPYNANYNFTVQLTDVASGDQGVVNFTGAIRGNAAGGASASINTETFSFAVAPQQLVLGGVTYQIAAKALVGPSSTGGVLSAGTFQGNVSIAAVPEPSSIALTALGGLALLGVARRRMKAAKV